MEYEWPEVFLEDIADELTVGFVGPMATQYVPEGIPFLRSLNVEPLRVVTADMKFITAEFHALLKKSALSPGDVVIVRTGKPGACVVIPDWLPVANCSDVVIVRCGLNLNPHFLAYYVNVIARDHVAAHLVGAVQQHFNVGAARRIRIPLPSMEEQGRIVESLRAIDQRIDVLEAQNKTLEGIAGAIFKSWFVDFDPVRAKAEGREPEGMDAATTALFPCSFQESELGQIPKGWSISTIGQTVYVIDCLHSKKPERLDKGKPFLQLSNIRDNGIVDMSDTYNISEDDYKKWISRIEASTGDCVITNVGRVGAVAQIPAGVKAALGRNMTGLRCKEDFPFATFLIELMMSDTMREEISYKTDSGTILDSLNVRSIPRLRFTHPPNPLLKRFEDTCRPLKARMEMCYEQMRALAELRDTLLPRLISGKLRVPEAEKLVEAAL